MSSTFEVRSALRAAFVFRGLQVCLPNELVNFEFNFLRIIPEIYSLHRRLSEVARDFRCFPKRSEAGGFSKHSKVSEEKPKTCELFSIQAFTASRRLGSCSSEETAFSSSPKVS